MAHQSKESDLLIHRVNSREAETPLLPSSPVSHGPRSLLKHLSCLPCNICVNSKPALLILVWCVIMGMIYLCLLSLFGIFGYVLQYLIHSERHGLLTNVLVVTIVLAFAFLALFSLMYPFSGYVADVCIGRYRTIVISLIMTWLALLSLCFTVIIAGIYSFKWETLKLAYIPFSLLLLLTLIFMLMGLAGYQANIIQLGLDQLLEAPSEKLGLFVHWLMWAYTLGNLSMFMILVCLPCYVALETPKPRIYHAMASSPFVFFFILTVLLAFTCYKHSWFYSEPGQNNPYKTVFQVLNFARKNKYPLRRSAFTFCDDVRPSRIDFAKERFGGPFTSPQVEDVKTFLRIVLVLFALGPVFVLEVPGSYYLFPLFALHVAQEVQFKQNEVCPSEVKWVLLQSGTVGYITSVIFCPLYICVIYSILRKRIPKILSRLWCVIFLPLVGVASMLITDVISHYRYRHYFFNNSDHRVCLFTSHFIYPTHNNTPNLLHMHWSVAIPPSILINVGCLLIHATSFEFISAQSPHSMKGLLVGVFFAIKGLFQFISAAAVVPFAIPKIWNHIYSVTNCGFGYYLFTIVVASIGLVVFSVVVRRYKYRQRDERPYDTRFAEAYYERYSERYSESSDGVDGEHLHHNELEHTAKSDSID